MQLDQNALIEEAVQASIDAGLAVNGEYGVAAARHAARFMFNALQAVRPWPVVKGSAPSAYLIERLAGSGYGSPRKVLDAAKYDPTQDEFWLGDAKSRHLVTPLYALAATASAEPVDDGFQGFVPHGSYCATEGCGNFATVHFIRGGIGSLYCQECYLKVQALGRSPSRTGGRS